METAKDTPAASSAPPQAIDEVPDPEEDDLDDLDDMLDEFSATTLDTKQDAPTASGPGRPAASSLTKSAEEIPNDFDKQLQEQMAALMGEINESPEMQQQMEAMMKELSAVGETSALQNGVQATTTSGAAAGASTAPEETFQETIRKTMERMHASGEQATAAATSNEGEDILGQMLQQMQGEGMGGTSEEDFSKMLMGIMEQLTNKDLLYEPMKELHGKYPEWMSRNREKTPKEDLRRYEEQQRLAGEIVCRLEGKGYSDDNAADRAFIVERMEKMQAAGDPPADLVGDMKDVQDALGDLDQGCPQQ